VDPYPLTSSDVDPKWIRITYAYYLPVMYLCYVWYFIVNIFGLIDYTGRSQEWTESMYIYGFYRFKNPELELPICLSSIIAIAIYTRYSIEAESSYRSLMGHLRRYYPITHSVCYIGLVNITPVVWTYLVIFSLI